MYRTRLRDQRAYTNYKLDVYQYQRYPSCSDLLQWRFNGGTSSWNNVSTGRFASMRDVTVPAFHKRSTKGEVFFNPCERVEIDIQPGSGYGGEVTATSLSCSPPYQYYGKTEYRLDGSLGRLTSGFGYPQHSDGHLIAPSTIISSSALSSLRTEVSTACLSNIGKADSNLYESLAEADKLLGMLPGIFKSGIDIARKRGFSSKAKSAASAYLAIRYGFLPVMKDVESILLGLKQISGRVRRTYRSQGSISSSSVTVSNSYGWSGMFTCKQTFTHNEVYTIRAMSLCEYYATVLSNIGFTTKGLLTVPWELVPYSFVVDWFVNVGDYIGALAPDANMTQLGSCLVEKRELTTNYTIESLSCAGGYTISKPVTGNSIRTVKTYARIPGPLVSGLVVKSDFRFDNLTRSLDALGLLVQKLR